MNETRLQQARRLYDIASGERAHQVEIGGIVPEDDDRERQLGVRWRAATPAGRVALGMWQKRLAELNAAQEYAGQVARAQRPDPRLPPERDDEEDGAP